MERFKELGVKAIPTSANFIYFTVDEDANAFTKRMQAEGVIVRSLVPWGAPNAIRVSIGTPEQNETFIRALKKLVRVAISTIATGNWQNHSPQRTLRDDEE